MNIRSEVEEFIALGPLPKSNEATVDQLKILQEALQAISSPVSREEAALLMSAFGPDDCYGLAWTLLHLIETAPGGAPIEKEPTSTANEWIKDLWARAQRGRCL